MQNKDRSSTQHNRTKISSSNTIYFFLSPTNNNCFSIRSNGKRSWKHLRILCTLSVYRIISFPAYFCNTGYFTLGCTLLVDSLELTLLTSLFTLLLVSVDDDSDSLVSFFSVFFDSFFTFLDTFSVVFSLFLLIKLGVPTFQTAKKQL